MNPKDYEAMAAKMLPLTHRLPEFEPNFDAENAAMFEATEALGSQYRKESAHDVEEVDHHRNAPKPSQNCLFGLIGDIARAGSENTEANPFAIAANAMAYLSAAIGRGAFTYVGNTRHHCRIFTLHVGRTGRGRKGDAASLIHRLDRAIRAQDAFIAPAVHSGGLSTREGLALMIHDGWTQGKTEVEAIHDKRLWVLESEFVNVLSQSKRDGNTLSSALRDCWDGVSIRPATKGQPRIWASDPHVNLSCAITGNELHSAMDARELTNGFANRFLIFWAERTKMMPFPRASTQHEVDALAARIIEVIRFAGGDRPVETDVVQVTMSAEAQALFAKLYLGELNDQSGGDIVCALLERRAPTLRRLAMLFAICDLTHEVDVQHINAALAWVRYWVDSAKFLFSDGAADYANEVKNDTAKQIEEYLKKQGEATRKDITVDCFQRNKSKTLIDQALDELLTSTPPRIEVRTVPRPKNELGRPTKVYKLSDTPTNLTNLTNYEHSCGLQTDFDKNELNELNELSNHHEDLVRIVRNVRKPENRPQTRMDIDSSFSSFSSLTLPEKTDLVDLGGL